MCIDNDRVEKKLGCLCKQFRSSFSVVRGASTCGLCGFSSPSVHWDIWRQTLADDYPENSLHDTGERMFSLGSVRLWH
eukprot:2696796-Amphidinium_carterae.1